MTNIMYLVQFLFRALIRFIKYIKDEEIHFYFTDIFLLYFGYQYVSAIHLDILGVIFESNRTVVIKKSLY